MRHFAFRVGEIVYHFDFFHGVLFRQARRHHLSPHRRNELVASFQKSVCNRVSQDSRRSLWSMRVD